MPNQLTQQKSHRLWTFQSIRSVEELKSSGILRAGWDRYEPSGYFIKSYQWMVTQMAERKISCQDHAPIWAWHSCHSYKGGPKLIDARCLLSDQELIDGIRTIEFECPAELVLLSNYGLWNSLLDIFYSDREAAVIDQPAQQKLFETASKNFRQYDSIQATLPYLKVEWVQDIRDLTLRPNDGDYRADEEV